MTAWKVSHQRAIEYEIVVSPNLLNPENDALLSVGRTENARRFVAVDSVVESLYGDALRRYFRLRDVEARIVGVAAGEENKNARTYFAILEELERFPIHRRDEPIIAVGGGALTDVVGFVAASYRRGVPHMKVPTTLMGYVDASVGIKNGFNFNGHKNRLGSFAAPQKVLLDKAFLQTLPMRHILNGVCEIFKLAVIKDKTLFETLEANGAECAANKFQDPRGDEILRRAISGMIEELEPNLFEDNLARSVDFGHTFAYGLETRYEKRLLHGEAVLLDIAISTLIARGRNLLSDSETARIFDLIAALNLKLQTDLLDPVLLLESLEERTYHRNGLQRVPLPKGIGECVFVNDVGAKEVETACKLMERQVADYASI